MRRVIRHLLDFGCALSLLLCIAVCVLWVRGLSGYDELAWTYDRYLADRSAASNQIFLTSNRHLWLTVLWGHVGPYNGQNVWGYHVNADLSGGHPRLRFRHELYSKMETWGFPIMGDPDARVPGIGPLRWETTHRSPPRDGDEFRFIRIGASHWLIALVLLVAPSIWMIRFLRSRRASKLGLCPACGYDLRATPERCPECGRAAVVRSD